MRKFKEQPTQKRLHELFYYEDGKLKRKVPVRNIPGQDFIGAVIGYRKKSGYFGAKVDNKFFFLHKLIWIFHNGKVPVGRLIDHIDRDPSNNSIENLRLSTDKENRLNTKEYTEKNLKHQRFSIKCTKDRLGVSRIGIRNRINGESFHYGYYATKEEATTICSFLNSGWFTYYLAHRLNKAEAK